MKPTRYMPKIRTFDGERYWKRSYAHQRGRLLRLAGVPDGQIASLVDRKYRELPVQIRYRIETGGITARDLE